MRCMCQIPGELSGGTCMALLTRRYDVLPTQMRMRIGNGQDIMGTVTVITLRRFRVSKLRHLSMIGVEIRFCNRLMTPTALLHDLQFESRLISPPDCVRRVAIVAYRQWLVRFSDEHGVDAPFELLLNSMMAASARLRNILRVHARQCVGLRQHAVRSMAACAGGGDRETALHQTSAMDALRIVLNDFVLRAGITRCRLLPFTMALCTQSRNICRKRWRVRAQLSKNAVRAVTLLAGRAVRIVLADEFSVYAHLILLCNLRMAGGTFHFLCDRLTGSEVRYADFGMALTARNLLVSRVSQFLVLHCQRTAILRRFQVRPFVTAETISVRHALRIENLANLVRLVTINAGRQHVCFLLPEFSTYDFPMHNLDLGVTLRARGSDVSARDG